MKKYTLTNNGKEILVLKVPEGRHEVSYDQWCEAYKYLDLAQESKKDFDDGNIFEATQKSIESISRLVSSLSTGVTYEQLIKVPYSKINNIFILDFGWLSSEMPKKSFKVKGKTFKIPNFSEKSAGDFMDVMDLIKQINDLKNDADLGLTIAAIYFREGDYKQDVEAINERKEHLKKYAAMDVLFSAGFFFSNSLMSLEKSMLQHLELEVMEELEKLTSSLSGWGTILYLQALQKAEY